MQNNCWYYFTELEYLRIDIYDRFHIDTGGWQKQRNNIYTRQSGVTIESKHELQFPRLKSLDLFLELESQLQIVS